MSDDLEIKIDKSSRKSTKDYLELTEFKNAVSSGIDILPDQSGHLLWPSFIKDHQPHLFGDDQFEVEQEDNFIVASNKDGCRVFDTSIEQLEPVLIVDDSLMTISYKQNALFSAYAQYLLVKVGRDQYPEDWCIRVYRVAPEGGDQMLCELKAADISENIPSEAVCDVSWVTRDCFLVYCHDEGSNYAAKWVFQMALEDEPHFKVVITCPMTQVCEDSPAFMYDKVAEDHYSREGNRYHGVELALALATKPCCWEVYAVQEDFRHLGTCCPFGNERNLSSSWPNESSRYATFYYLDDNESNREVCVYDFGPDPKHLTLTQCFKAPMFPGESYSDVSLWLRPSASSTLLHISCTAEGKEEAYVYDLSKCDERKNDIGNRKASMAAMAQDAAVALVGRLENTSSKNHGQAYGAFGSVPDYLENEELLGVIYAALPSKYFIASLHDETSVSVFDIENKWSVVVDNFKPFGDEKFETHFHEEIGSVLATRPSSTTPCVLLLFPVADTVKETRQEFKLIDLKNQGHVVREEKLEFHECFLTPQHGYVITRFHLNFTIFPTSSSLTQRRQILDWDFEEGSEVASRDIIREVSPDDRFLAVAARHQIRIFELHSLSLEPIAIIDFAECKELSFKSCLPSSAYSKSMKEKVTWDHLYYEDGGKVWVRYEQETNQFVVLHKIDTNKSELILLSKTLMLAFQPVNEYYYSWEPQSAEGESLAVLRVDLDLQNVLDLSTLKCNVTQIGKSQRVLVSNKTTLRVLDFTIADRLVDHLTLMPECSIISIETVSRRQCEMCAMILSDATLRAQQLSIVTFKRTGPEMMTMPNDGVRFAPFGGKKFSLQFLPSYSPTHIILISVSDEISLYELGSSLTPVASVQNYVLPSKYDDDVSMHDDDKWIEIRTLKGIQMISLAAASDDSYNPRTHYLPINNPQGFRSLNDNVVSLVKDKNASLAIYELQDDAPVEVFALNRICDQENKTGAPEISYDTTSDSRFLLIQNCYTYSADSCFVLVYDLKTKSKTPIFRRNYGQNSHTNFAAFFPRGSDIHLVICTPGGKNVEVYDMYTCAANINHRDKEKREPVPILKVSVDTNDFLKCIERDSFRVSTSSEMDEEIEKIFEVEEKKREEQEEKRKEQEEKKKEQEEKKKQEDTKKKPLPPSRGAKKVEEEKPVSSSSPSPPPSTPPYVPMTDEQKKSKTIIMITQKSRNVLSFYYISAYQPPELLRSVSRPFGMLEASVDESWPWISFKPTANENQIKFIKIIEKKGKFEMNDTCDYTPRLVDSTEIKDTRYNETDKVTYVKITNATEIAIHVLGDKPKEIFKYPCDTQKTTFDFCREDHRALLYSTGTSNVFFLNLQTGAKHNLLPPKRKNEKLSLVKFEGDNLIMITTKSVLIFEYKREGNDLSQAVNLIGEIDIDPTWPTGSWEFEMRLDNKLAIITRTDYCACLAVYRNVKLLETDSERTTKWPLLDVPIDQKTDPEWANAQFKYAGDYEYVYCYSPAKKGITIVDLSRAVVPWYPIITWSSTENVLKYDLARSTEQMPNVDRFLQLYEEILVGPMSPKDPLSAINHLCTSNHGAINDGRHRALQLFLSHMPRGAFEITATPVPTGEDSPRARWTVLGSLIAKKDWMSITILLDFLVVAAAHHKLVPLSDTCVEFAFELVDLAYKHSPSQVARFLKDFALQKLPSTSPVATDAARNLRGVNFGDFRFLTCGSHLREPNKLWSVKYKDKEGGGERYDVCYVAIPGFSSDGTPEHPKPAFHQLVQVAQDTSCAELIANPAIEAIIDFKWHTFARVRFMISFGLHIFATFCVILFCCFLPLQNKEDALFVVGATPEGRLCIAMLIIFSAYAVYNLVKESRELAVQGFATYLGLWNLAANLQSALLITTAVLYLARSTQTHFVAGASVVICHIYILFYLQALETTGPLIRMILQITSDMKYFTGVLFLCLLACTFFYIVVTEGQGIGAGNVVEVWLRMYMTFFFFNFDSSGIDGLETFEQVTVSYLMIVAGSMFVAIVLLNLLIALMGDSFAAIKSRDTLELQLLRAGMVRDIEFTMTIKTAAMVKERFPRWIHCLLPIKEHQVREANETLIELRKLKMEMSKLEERLEHMSFPGAGGGNVGQRRGSVMNPRGSAVVGSKRESVVASTRNSTAAAGDVDLDELLRQLAES